MGKESTGIDTRAVKAAREFLGLPVAAKNTVTPADLEYAELIAEWEKTPAESEREQEIKKRMEELILDCCSNPEKLVEYWDITKSHSLKQLIQKSIGKLFAAVRPKKEVPEWAVSLLRRSTKEKLPAFLCLHLHALAQEILAAGERVNNRKSGKEEKEAVKKEIERQQGKGN